MSRSTTSTAHKPIGRVLAPVRAHIVVACVLQAVASVAGVVPYAAVAVLGTELLDPDRVGDGRARTIAAVAIVGLALRLIFSVGALTVTHQADTTLQLHLRREMTRHLGRVPLGWFGERTSGEVKKAMQDDVAAIHYVVAHSYLDVTAAVVTPLVVLGYLASVDWRFTLVAMIPLLVGVALLGRNVNGAKDHLADHDHALGEISTAVVEFVQGISVIKAFGQAGRAHRRFRSACDAFVAAFTEWAPQMLRSTALAEVVLSPLSSLAMVLGGGTLFVANGWIDATDVLPFALLAMALSAPIMTLHFAEQALRLASQAAERIVALLDVPELPAPSTTRAPHGLRVELHDVRFSYDGTTPVLDGIDLILEPGTATALVGPSGSGKSTLARLLPRFWDPTSGRITLGDVDLREVAPADLYRSIGFVFQDIRLLGTTVRDNIRLARPDADQAAVEGAARAAQVHDRILELPRGYDSVIGDDARLSGGEAQRVSIARAILADAPILVLDEATAFADPESEAAIQDAISALVAGRTLLVIAHRLQTIVGADQIVVLDRGRVAQRGTHPELVARDGLYRSLWAAHESATPELVEP